MPFSLNLYHDQLGASGGTSTALPPGPRMIYCRFGKAVVNGAALSADEAIFCDTPVELKSAGEWAQLWRWDLALPNAAPALAEGEGVLSQLRMARIIAT